MKHSPVDTLGQWSMSSGSIGPSFSLLGAAKPAGQKHAASKPPLLLLMREQHINTSYPLRWGTWFLERWKTGRRVKLLVLGQEKGVKQKRRLELKAVQQRRDRRITYNGLEEIHFQYK